MPEKSNGNVIETSGLTKHYGKVKAVQDVSLSVKKGEVYGFLGLNGAGKTTTIRMLLGMIRPSAGEAILSGKSISPGHPGPWNKIGYLVEMPYSYPELTVKENLKAYSRLRNLKGMDAVNSVMDHLQLSEYKNIKAKNLSLGNNQRLGLAKALIHDPEVLILDEPSNGLDPAGIVEIRELLHDMASKRRVTVFISSHNLSEISKIATRIGIIHRGKLIQEIDTGKLDSVLKKTLLIGTRDVKAASQIITKNGYSFKLTDNGTISISDQKAAEKPEMINSLLVNAGSPPYFFMLEQEDLETYFLRIIGESVC